jgi:hypothetical protein
MQVKVQNLIFQGLLLVENVKKFNDYTLVVHIPLLVYRNLRTKIHFYGSLATFKLYLLP